MSIFPDWIFKFTPRDEQVTPIEIVNIWRTQNTVAQDLTTADYVVPIGKILIVSSLTIQCQAAGAQRPRYIQAYYLPNGSSNVNDKFVFHGEDFEARLPATGNVEYGGWNKGDVFIPGGATIRAFMHTDGAAVSAHDLQLFMTGILIPRGNFAV